MRCVHAYVIVSKMGEMWRKTQEVTLQSEQHSNNACMDYHVIFREEEGTNKG